MSGINRKLCGVLRQYADSGLYHVTFFARFYQNNPRLKASGLTEEEAEAMCTLMNAGRGDD